MVRGGRRKAVRLALHGPVQQYSFFKISDKICWTQQRISTTRTQYHTSTTRRRRLILLLGYKSTEECVVSHYSKYMHSRSTRSRNIQPMSEHDLDRGADLSKPSLVSYLHLGGKTLSGQQKQCISLVSRGLMLVMRVENLATALGQIIDSHLFAI